MHDLGMELHAIEITAHIGGRGKRRIARGRDNFKPIWDFADAVAVAHPHALRFANTRQAFKEQVLRFDGQICAAKFFFLGRLNRPAKLRAHGLLPVTYAEYRQTARKHAFIRARATNARHAIGATREYNRFGVVGINHRLISAVIRMHFAVNPALAHAPRNELGHLRAKVDNQEAFMLGVGHVIPIQNFDSLG